MLLAIVEEVFYFPNYPYTSLNHCLQGPEISLIRAWFYTFWVSWIPLFSTFLFSSLFREETKRVFLRPHLLPPHFPSCWLGSVNTMAQTCWKPFSRCLSQGPNCWPLASWPPNVSSSCRYSRHCSCYQAMKAHRLLWSWYWRRPNNLASRVNNCPRLWQLGCRSPLKSGWSPYEANKYFETYKLLKCIETYIEGTVRAVGVMNI